MSQRLITVVWLPLKPELDLEKGNPKKVWDETLDILARQQGCKNLFWGRQVETPDTVTQVLEWSSLSDFDIFAVHPDYKRFLENLAAILADAPTVFHVNLPCSGGANPLAQPVTECIAAYFPPEQSEPEYVASFTKFGQESGKIPEMQSRSTGFSGLVGGFSLEKHEHENLGEGVKGKLFAAFIGWPNIEAHMNFRKLEDFGKIVPLLRGGAKGIKMCHVSFKQYK